MNTGSLVVASQYPLWKRKKDKERVTLASIYHILGYISSGTYGKVYKARKTLGKPLELFAIKVFKTDKSGEHNSKGISQSACREMALCRELVHVNIVFLHHIFLEPSIN
jgi:cyclin-dependent kinase 8/11